MADTKKDRPKPDKLTSNPPWLIGLSPVGSVHLDTPSPCKQDTANDKNRWRNTELPPFRVRNQNSSIFSNLSKRHFRQVMQEYPVDIFGNNPNSSEIMSDPKYHPVDMFQNHPGRRRLSIITDHCHSFKPLERITGDAEELDLENKLRSAVASLPHRHPSPEKPTKSVKWDPAIISCRSTPPPITESKPTTHNGQDAVGLKDCLQNFQAILSLKKSDRVKLRGLLEALSKIDGDRDSSIVQAGSTNAKKGSLNPLATEFRATLSLRNQNRSKNLSDRNRWMPEPIWIRTSKPINLLRQPFVQKIPTIEIQHEVEYGHGREAKTLDPAWAKSVLEKFTAKYPLTGTVQPELAKGRMAAAIQQRLEYLLFQKKEKKALLEAWKTNR